MIKSFLLSDENEINEFWEKNADGIQGGAMVNVEPGSVVFQIDGGTERRGLLNGLRTAHGELLAKKLSREADRRFYMAELIRMNGKISLKQGGSGRQDELMGAIAGIEKQIHDIEQEQSLYDHQLRTNREIYSDIKAGKMDDLFI